MSIGPSRPLVLEKPKAVDLRQAARYCLPSYFVLRDIWINI